MNSIIHQAIKARNLIRFEHEGRSHIGEPHAYITCEKGDEYLEIFQFCGVYGHWKILPLSDLTRIKPFKQLHFDPREDEILRQSRPLFRTICQA